MVTDGTLAVVDDDAAAASTATGTERCNAGGTIAPITFENVVGAFSSAFFTSALWDLSSVVVG